VHVRIDEANDDLEPGAIVGGRFCVVAPLGRGGMATVYQAKHLMTGRPVALKVASQRLLSHPVLSSRFLREARTASTLRHPHAIEVMDVFEAEDGRPVMVMELLLGEDLGQRLSEQGRLSVGETAHIFLPVLSALAAAHAQGIVHRDIKPDNIFLSRVGGQVIPKVLDFGIAKVVGDAVDRATLKLTSTGMLLGTPYYMSPEQVSGSGDIDHRADIWSLGVVLYETLMGLLPFRGDNFGQVFAAILQKDPAGMAGAGVPADVERMVLRCMAKRREDRPGSCGALATVLAQFTDVRVTSYPPPARPRDDHAFDSISGVRLSQAPTLAEEPSAAPGATVAERRGSGRRAMIAGLLVTGLVLAALATWVALDGTGTGPTTDDGSSEGTPRAGNEPTAPEPDPVPTRLPETPGTAPHEGITDEVDTTSRPQSPGVDRPRPGMRVRPASMGMAAEGETTPMTGGGGGIIQQL